jgi:serine/threonine protein kinase
MKLVRPTAGPDSTKPVDSEQADRTEILPPEARHERAGRPPSFERSRIGEYIVESIIGEGGGGTVFAARHPKTSARVAIKVLRSEMVPMPHLVTRFNREVELISKLAHPNIVQVIEYGETDRGQPYYVMELLEGHNLRRLLQLHGRFSPAEMLALIEPICGALKAVHEAGFVHRDIKGSNVIVVEDDGARLVKLLDFGIAKMVQGEASGQGLTEPGAKLGSVHTMAPEQIRSEKLDARADIYALGVVIYQLLTGDYPFHAEDPRQIAFMHLQAPPPQPSSRAAVSPALDAIVLRCMEKQVDRRYASVDELVAALRAAVGDTPPAEPERLLQGLGVYVQFPAEPEAELDDAMIEDVGYVLDAAEQCLISHGFELPLRTSYAMLGVRVAPSNEIYLDPTDASELVAELQSVIAERPDPHHDVRIEVSVRVDGVRCRTGTEITGGALLDLKTWTDAHRRIA